VKLNITLISLPKATASYSLLTLASYVNGKTEHRVRILDLSGVEGADSVILASLKGEKPDIVGFSCFTRDYPEVMRLSGLIKEQLGCRIVVGNVHASLYPEDFIFSGSPVDFAVVGEGEITFSELLAKIGGKENPCGIAGVASLDPAGKMAVGARRPLISDLSVLPQIDYRLVPVEPYFKPANRIIRGAALRTAVVYASRGCPSACEFCAANTVWQCNTGPSVRFRPVEDVIAEIRNLKSKYGIQGIMFGDDSFVIKRERVLQFCDELEKLDIFWSVQGRVTQVDEEMVSAMKKSGCVMLCFGVESGSDTVLKRINKGITVEQIRRAFSICKKAGVRCLADIMCNHPGETEEDVKLTAELLREIAPAELSQAAMTPYPGTKIYEKYVKTKPRDYYVFSNIGHEIEKHFKLCEHDIPLKKILDSYFRIVYHCRLPGSFTLLFRNFKYVREVVLSRHCVPILTVILEDLASQLRYCAAEHLRDPLRKILGVVKTWSFKERR